MENVTNRNPVTGNGVTSWDCRSSSRNNTPRIHTERNPVTGETYTIVSPATTPTNKPVQNGFVQNISTSTPIQNGNHAPQSNGISTPNGNA
ncbi:hypothetical protein NQ318_001163 [Aromia moschata]|uniref:Uncharacterized protein n=1 Tax=Aromia moschata TaxID=1265417 RepID=A0AAV8ZE51_9CUCU|nr:hypothetical protein NQ318_001163 [Aromia moschata]